jgi:hypothetical protein
MSRVTIQLNKSFLLNCACIAIKPISAGRGTAAAAPSFKVRIARGHAWRPPVGLDGVGRPIVVVVDASESSGAARFTLTAFLKGNEIDRAAVSLPSSAPLRLSAALLGSKSTKLNFPLEASFRRGK